MATTLINPATLTIGDISDNGNHEVVDINGVNQWVLRNLTDELTPSEEPLVKLEVATPHPTTAGKFYNKVWDVDSGSYVYQEDLQNGSQEYTRTSSFSVGILDKRVQTVYNFTGTTVSNAQVGADNTTQGDGNTTSTLVKNNGTANLNIQVLATLSGGFIGASVIEPGQAMLISYTANGLSANGYILSGESNSGIDPWEAGKDYEIGDLFTFTTTNTTAVDINGNKIVAGETYIGKYETAKTSNGTLTNAEMALIEIVSDEQVSVTPNVSAISTGTVDTVPLLSDLDDMVAYHFHTIFGDVTFTNVNGINTIINGDALSGTNSHTVPNGVQGILSRNANGSVTIYYVTDDTGQSPVECYIESVGSLGNAWPEGVPSIQFTETFTPTTTGDYKLFGQTEGYAGNTGIILWIGTTAGGNDIFSNQAPVADRFFNDEIKEFTVSLTAGTEYFLTGSAGGTTFAEKLNVKIECPVDENADWITQECYDEIAIDSLADTGTTRVPISSGTNNLQMNVPFDGTITGFTFNVENLRTAASTLQITVDGQVEQFTVPGGPLGVIQEVSIPLTTPITVTQGQTLPIDPLNTNFVAFIESDTLGGDIVKTQTPQNSIQAKIDGYGGKRIVRTLVGGDYQEVDIVGNVLNDLPSIPNNWTLCETPKEYNTPSCVELSLDALNTNIGDGVENPFEIVSEWNTGANFPITSAYYHISLDPTQVGVAGTVIDPAEGETIDVYLVGWASDGTTGAPNTNGQMSGIRYQVTRTNGELVVTNNQRKISSGFTTAQTNTTAYSDITLATPQNYDGEVFLNGAGFNTIKSDNPEKRYLQFDGTYNDVLDGSGNSFTVEEVIALGYKPYEYIPEKIDPCAINEYINNIKPFHLIISKEGPSAGNPFTTNVNGILSTYDPAYLVNANDLGNGVVQLLAGSNSNFNSHAITPNIVKCDEYIEFVSLGSSSFHTEWVSISSDNFINAQAPQGDIRIQLATSGYIVYDVEGNVVANDPTEEGTYRFTRTLYGFKIEKDGVEIYTSPEVCTPYVETYENAEKFYVNTSFHRTTTPRSYDFVTTNDTPLTWFDLADNGGTLVDNNNTLTNTETSTGWIVGSSSNEQVNSVSITMEAQNLATGTSNGLFMFGFSRTQGTLPTPTWEFDYALNVRQSLVRVYENGVNVAAAQQNGITAQAGDKFEVRRVGTTVEYVYTPIATGVENVFWVSNQPVLTVSETLTDLHERVEVLESATDTNAECEDLEDVLYSTKLVGDGNTVSLDNGLTWQEAKDKYYAIDAYLYLPSVGYHYSPMRMLTENMATTGNDFTVSSGGNNVVFLQGIDLVDGDFQLNYSGTDNFTIKIVGIKTPKTVINTTDIEITQQVINNVIVEDRGIVREMSGQATIGATGEVIVTLPLPMSGTNYEIFVSDKLNSGAAKSHSAAPQNATQIRIMGRFPNNTAAVGNVSWMVRGQKPI